MNKKTAVIITAIVALIVGIAGTYAYVSNVNNEDIEKLNNQIAELQAENQSLTESPVATTSPNTTTSPTSDETANWQTYTNDEYGFSLTLNDNWEGYKVEDWKEVNTEGPAPAKDIYSFYLPSTDSNWPSLEDGYAKVFVIHVYPNNVYDSLNEGDLNPSKIGKNDKYTIAVSTWHDAPSDLRVADLGINEIFNSIAFE